MTKRLPKGPLGPKTVDVLRLAARPGSIQAIEDREELLAVLAEIPGDERVVIEQRFVYGRTLTE
jgi:DNA-directed RNA polymerase specialized sigma24 family protein